MAVKRFKSTFLFHGCRPVIDSVKEMVAVKQADGAGVGGGDGGGVHILWSLYLELEPNAVPHVQQTCSLDHKCQSALKET